MKNILPSLSPRLAWAMFAALLPLTGQAQYASQVIGYQSGTGFATEFGTGLGYTTPGSALGEPSRVTPGDYGGPVDPFNPPYLRDQIVSLGTGGSLTVGLAAQNSAANPYGIDFQIYGNTGFIIINGDYSGGGITDGSTFGQNSGQTRVSVSSDGLSFYVLNPALAPVADGLFPSLGTGDFTRPVDPALKNADFANLGLTEIRQKYGGSGGGTGYDIAWAVDANGAAVRLDAIQFVRVEVISGHSEIDAFAAVRDVPEPSVWALLLAGSALAGISLVRSHRSGV